MEWLKLAFKPFLSCRDCYFFIRRDPHESSALRDRSSRPFQVFALILVTELFISLWIQNNLNALLLKWPKKLILPQRRTNILSPGLSSSPVELPSAPEPLSFGTASAFASLLIPLWGSQINWLASALACQEPLSDSQTKLKPHFCWGKTHGAAECHGRVPLTLCEPVRKILRWWQDIKVAITKWDTQFLRGKPPRCEKEKPRDRSPLKNPLYKWYEYNHVLPVQQPEQNRESSYK